VAENNSCVAYSGELFDQLGRLSFDWSYQFAENEMLIDLVFSQPDIAYYYYENGKGYTYEDYQK